MGREEMPVIDLHNDLLSYLTQKLGRSPEDPISRSSHPQMMQGHVKLQVLAIFSITGRDSVANGKSQVNKFVELLRDYPMLFSSCSFPFKAGSQVQIIPAIENASSFASESEPLIDALLRLDEYIKQIGPILYISMTWDDENRFGGGNRSSIGLKEDGKRLLEWMSGKKIAIDMSHTSDRLAHGIFDFMEQKGLNIPVIASHSNFRAVSNYPRNLPDDIAKEIIRRKGLIGLNFFAPFIHQNDYSVIVRHVEYGLELGAADALCFGADFFYDTDFSYIREKYQRESAFFPELGNSSVYPDVLKLFEDKLRMKQEQLEKIAYKNASKFLSNLMC